ncbi:hypothetical protein CAY57_17170 [Heyndrickxia coagulans]|nr:hypothetical protein CAY57_17170 [Heyndrickxia coagulans]
MNRRKQNVREEAGLEFGDINAGKIYEIMAESGTGKKRKNAKKIKNEDGSRHPFCGNGSRNSPVGPRIITISSILPISFDISSQKEYVLK